MIDMAIVTEMALLNSKGELLEKDADGCHLMNLFLSRGIDVRALAWDDTGVDWSIVKNALISSTWNYQKRPEAFLSWLDQVHQTRCQIVNDPKLLQWNLNKRYLLQLEQKGIRIPETHILKSALELYDPKWALQFKSESVVVKPSISASAEGTILIENFSEFIRQERPSEFMAGGALLLQPFLSTIQERGERSLIFIEGIYSHAFNKTPAEGDFRVQREFGGKQELYIPTEEEIDFAQACLIMVTQLIMQPVYARIDICHDNQNELVLMELELIEPELWLSASSQASDRLAQYFLRNL